MFTRAYNKLLNFDKKVYSADHSLAGLDIIHLQLIN